MRGQRTLPATDALRITNATLHNLKNLTVEIPLQRFVCLTGVSGSGKTTLIREILLPALEGNLKSQISNAGKASDEPDSDAADTALTSNLQPFTSKLTSWESLKQVVLVDQSPLGKTPRSNPAVYIGAFEDIRELFAQTELAKQRGLNASVLGAGALNHVGQLVRQQSLSLARVRLVSSSVENDVRADGVSPR